MSVTQLAEAMVSIETSRFGTVSIAEDKLLTFVQGIPGFERLRRYVLLDHDADGLVKWLQAVDDPDVAFLLTDPSVYKKDYTVPLKKIDAERLGAERTEDLVSLVMVCVSKEDGRITLNLKAPVVFNAAGMTAMQCIIDKDDYKTHYQIKP